MKQTMKFFTFFSIFALFVITFGCTESTPNKNTANTNRNVPTHQTNNAAAEISKNAPPGAQPPNALGSPTASVTVEEFADFQCPSCGIVHTIMKNIQSTYGTKINFIYRHYPLAQLHKNAYEAAVAAEAAGQQGRFWDMQNQLFTNQKAWSNSTDVRPIFADYAQKIGLDVARYQSDILAMSTKLRVDDDIKRGNALKLDSTPTIYINGKSVPTPQMNLEAIRALIDAELQNPGNKPNQAAQPAAPAGNTAANSGNKATNTAQSNAANTAVNAPNAAKPPAKQ